LFQAHHEGRDAGEVGLKSHGEQVEHEPRVFGLVGGKTVPRLADCGYKLGRTAFQTLDAGFDIADRKEVLVEFALVGRT
jgi:hypothetical protein